MATVTERMKCASAAALIEAAAKTYAIERQCESAERIADALRDIADALKGRGEWPI